MMNILAGKNFRIALRGWGEFPPSEGGCNILLGKIILSGSGNLTRSDFDHSKLFQSQKQIFVNIEHRFKSKLARLVSTKGMKLEKNGAEAMNPSKMKFVLRYNTKIII